MCSFVPSSNGKYLSVQLQGLSLPLSISLRLYFVRSLYLRLRSKQYQFYPLNTWIYFITSMDYICHNIFFRHSALVASTVAISSKRMAQKKCNKKKIPNDDWWSGKYLLDFYFCIDENLTAMSLNFWHDLNLMNNFFFIQMFA